MYKQDSKSAIGKTMPGDPAIMELLPIALLIALLRIRSSPNK
jgi:hypothetical protein